MFTPDEKNFIIVALCIIVGITLGKVLRSKNKSSDDKPKPVDPNTPLSTTGKFKLHLSIAKNIEIVAKHLKLIEGHFQFHNLPPDSLTAVIVALQHLENIVLDKATVDKNFNKITTNILAMLQGQYGLIVEIPDLPTVDNQVIYSVIKELNKTNSKLVTQQIVDRLASDLLTIQPVKEVQHE